jgi:hypothetical protein
MMERRRKRSYEPVEALQYLMEAVKDRSEVRAVALVDEGGRIRAGTGYPEEMVTLARLGSAVARGEPAALDALTGEDDLLACPFALGETRVCLAAIGTSVRKMPEAVRAARRILAA